MSLQEKYEQETGNKATQWLIDENSYATMYYTEDYGKWLEDQSVKEVNDKPITWELRNKEIVGYTFEGDGVYIVKKTHQKEYDYVLFWVNNDTLEKIKLQESDHLLLIMNWAVKHWSLK